MAPRLIRRLPLLLIPLTAAVLVTVLVMGTINGLSPDGFLRAETMNAPSEPPSLQNGVLRVHPANPRYFTDDSGKPIYLTGSHTWDNLQDWGGNTPAFDYTGYLDLLQAHNHNFIRLWGAWVGAAGQTDANVTATPVPWLRTGPGTAHDGRPRYDLSRFDQTYFDRIRSRVIQAGNRGIYVSVMFFLPATYGEWSVSPYNPANNVNGINGDPNGDGDPLEVETLTLPALLTLQKAFARKIIDTVNDLDNVLYEIGNEFRAPDSINWQYELIEYVKRYQSTKPKQHPVGMTSDGGAPPDDTLYLLKSPADWISLGWDETIQDYRTDPLPAPATKVSILDTDHIFGGPADRQWFWKSFLRGHNPIHMEATQNGIPTWVGRGTWNDTDHPHIPAAQRTMGHTRSYADRINLAAMVPSGHLTSTRYALADPGAEYLIYQPGSGAFSVNLVAGTYDIEWTDPGSGTTSPAGSITTGSGSRSFTPPFRGDAVLYLKASTASHTPSRGSGAAGPAGAWQASGGPAAAFARSALRRASVEPLAEPGSRPPTEDPGSLTTSATIHRLGLVPLP